MSQFFASGGQSNGASVSTIPVPSCRLEGGCPEPVPHWTLSYLPELRTREGCGQKPKEFSLKKKKKNPLEPRVMSVGGWQRGAATPLAPENHMASV